MKRLPSQIDGKVFWLREFNVLIGSNQNETRPTQVVFLFLGYAFLEVVVIADDDKSMLQFDMDHFSLVAHYNKYKLSTAATLVLRNGLWSWFF